MQELGLDSANISVRAHHAPPDGPVVSALLEGLCLVDIGDALAQVEVDLWLGADTVNLQQCSVVHLVGLGPLETKDL